MVQGKESQQYRDARPAEPQNRDTATQQSLMEEQLEKICTDLKFIMGRDKLLYTRESLQQVISILQEFIIKKNFGLLGCILPKLEEKVSYMKSDSRFSYNFYLYLQELLRFLRESQEQKQCPGNSSQARLGSCTQATPGQPSQGQSCQPYLLSNQPKFSCRPSEP